MQFIALTRNPKFSPNREEADAAIFEAVATRLEAMGHEVVRMTDEEFHNAFPDDNPTYDPAMKETLKAAERIFTMSRDTLTCMLLDIVERFHHVPCTNTAMGISSCANRQIVYQRLQQAGIAQPQTWVGSLYQDRWPNDPEDAYALVDTLPYPIWIKRCDGYSEVAEDVALAADVAQARDILDEMKGRGIGEVTLSQHIVGDLIKFYGVAGTDFFDWDYADLQNSKLGQEVQNGMIHRYPFDAAALQTRCQEAAQRMGVPVYGGDAIVTADGTCYVIDFNDWPSFSRCRQRAADAIVALLLK